MNLGELYVRLIADPSGVNRGVDQASREFGRLEGVVKKLGVAIAGVFAAERIIAFGRDSLRTFAEADAIWNRLAATLRSAGIEFRRVERDIQQAARAMQDVTVVGDEDFAQILQSLVAITGDYAASMREVETVADLAAGAQVDLRTAAQLVGRAMVGQTGTLSRYGNVVAEGADAMEVLRSRFDGLARAEVDTLSGALAQLNNEFGDLQEAVGRALVGGDDAVETVNNLANAIRGLAEWVDDNAEVFDGLRRAVTRFAEDAVRDVGDIIEVFNRLERGILRFRDFAASLRFGLAFESGFPRLLVGIEQAQEAAGGLSAAMADALAEGHALPPVVKQTEEDLKAAAKEAERVAALFAQIAQIPQRGFGIEIGDLVPTLPQLQMQGQTIKLATGQTVEVAGLKAASERIARLAETTAALDLTMKDVPAPVVEIPDVGRLEGFLAGINAEFVTAATTASRGLIDMGDAAGVLGDRSRRAINGVNNLIASLSGITELSGAALGGAVVGVAGSVAQVLAGVFGESQAERERNRIIQGNSDELRRLTQSLSGFRVTFDRMAAALDAIDAASDSTIASNPRLFDAGRVEREWERILSGAGTTFGELEAIAERFGITIRDSAGNIIPAALRQLESAILASRLSVEEFGKTLDGARALADARLEIFDLTDPIDRLRSQFDLLADTAPDLLREFGLANLNVDTEAGRAVLENGLREIFEQFAAGNLGADALGDFTSVEEFLQALTGTDRALDAMAETVNNVTSALSNVPPIFDLALRRRMALLTGDVSGGSPTNPADPFGPVGGLPGTRTPGGPDAPGRPRPTPALVVHINNPPAGMDAAAEARRVTRVLSEELSKGGASELRVAIQRLANAPA